MVRDHRFPVVIDGQAYSATIEAYLFSGRDRVFVAVGALHLAGPRGLVEILRSRGHTVRQL